MFHTNSLDVGHPATIAAFVGETHGLSVAWLLAADLTPIRHGKTPGVVGEIKRPHNAVTTEPQW